MKKSIFGLTLAVLALAAVALVPAATADLYGSSADGLYSDSLVVGGFCEKDVCIGGTDCESTTDDLGCNVSGDGCNTYRCQGGVSPH